MMQSRPKQHESFAVTGQHFEDSFQLPNTFWSKTRNSENLYYI